MTSKHTQQAPMPVVTLGASAGGLEQITQFLRDLPADTGAAYIVLQHLSPTHKSQLAELLSQATEMPVATIENGMALAADRVYVIPEGARLAIAQRRLTLEHDQARTVVPTLIDQFLRQLADDCGDHAVGVILSGTGHDGALGLKAIKVAGGLTLVQSPEAAEHGGMPRAAIEACEPDHVDDTPGLVRSLCNHLRHNLADRPDSDSDSDSDSEDSLANEISQAQLDAVLEALREHDSQHNFGCYKPNMLKRRIRRRMGLRGIARVADYEQLLRDESAERATLGREFLITVTDFFREPQAYNALYESAIVPLLGERDASETLRIWVAGCATGEEAYGIAMLVADGIAATGHDHSFVVFASDIDERALDSARRGVYPESIAADIGAARLERFFDKVDSHYQIKRSLRERVVFAAQNIIDDPPYSRLDIISCRNLLIYFTGETQERIIARFHFALKQHGILLLGSAETIGDNVDLFSPLASEHRLFRRVGANRRYWVNLPEYSGARAAGAARYDERSSQPPAENAEKIARDLLLEAHVPAAVLVNRKLEILCSFGPTGDFFTLPFGQSSLGLMEMARPEYRNNLRAVTYRAFREHESNAVSTAQAGEDGRGLRITARPVDHSESVRGLALITFERTTQAVAVRDAASQSETERELADELEATRDELKSTIHALTASNEDLKGSNEEILSMNEELQSTNEELETSKEELQSVNEELTTVNAELEDKLAELEDAHNDLENLFSGTRVATLFLDRRLYIKRFTPEVADLLRVITSDIGRPLADITLRFDDPDLRADTEAAMDDLGTRDRQVQADNGRWYQRRVLPYRTRDDHIDGAVITFADITELKRAAMASRASEQRLNMAMNAIDGGMWDTTLDPDKPDELPDTMYISPRLKRLIGFEDEQFPNSLHAWQQRIVAADRDAFAQAARRQPGADPDVVHYRIRHRDNSLRWFASYSNVLYDDGDDAHRWIGIDCDITDEKHTEMRARATQAQLRLLAGTLAQMVAFVDNHGVIKLSNSACHDYFGVAADQIAGRGVAALTGGEAYAKLAPYLEKAHAGRAVTCELAIAGHAREAQTLDVKLLPHTTDGEQLGFFLVMTPQSDPQRGGRDRREQPSRMVDLQRLASLGQIAGSLAHDVKQPLTAIQTYAETLMRKLHAGDAADDTTPLLHKIAAQVERASEIIDHTRAFVGNDTAEQDTLDLNEIAGAAIALLAPRARRLNVAIESATHAALAPVPGYAVQIRQVVVNLIDNAFDALEGREEGQRKVWVATEMPDAGHARLSVTDSGGGIPADKIDTVFQSFNSTKLSGLGLGLAIGRTIVQAHGGRLWAESADGQGATFILELPVAGAKPNG